MRGRGEAVGYRKRTDGGAVGNAIDRLAHGAVVDFVLFHVTTASFEFNWYVFNLADAAIVLVTIKTCMDATLQGSLLP